MEYRKTLEIRNRLAAPFLQSFREDLLRAPGSARRFLEHLADHLFDPEFQVGAAYMALELDPDELRRAFQVAFGLAPKAYLRTLRLKVAKALLTSTKIPVGLISELVGYASSKTLGHAFKLHEGLSPLAYRQRQQTTQPQFTAGLVQQLNAGALEEGEARRLVAHLRAQYPEVFTDERPIHLQLGDVAVGGRGMKIEELEMLNAQRFWAEIKDLPQETQEHKIQIANLFSFRTPALFEFFQRRSFEVSRDQRSDGLRVAQLALVAAQTFERPCVETGKSALWAQGWATLGNSRRLTLDFESAEKAFSQAEHFLPEKPSPSVEGEVLNLIALFKWYQRDYQEGIQVIDRAISSLDSSEDGATLARALIIQSILYEYLGEFQQSIASLTRVLNLLPTLTESDIAMAAYYNLARCYRKQGNHELAQDILVKMRQLSHQLEIHVYTIYIDWFEGRIALDRGDVEMAAEKLNAARSNFLLIGSKQRAKLVGLDLAIVYWDQGQESEVWKLASEAKDVLDRWRHHEHVEDAWRKLRRALLRKKIERCDLVSIRDSMDHFQEAPLSQKFFDFSVAAV